MGALVYNALGATEEDPCPTAKSVFFKGATCTREDYRKWRAQAQAMYTGGLLQLWQQLAQVEAGQAELLRPSIQRYMERFNALPEDGSAFFPARNAQRIAEALAVMIEGETTLASLDEAIRAAGATPLAMQLPPKPATKTEHNALRAYVFPIAAGTAGVVVFGLTMWAIFGGSNAGGD